MQGWKFPAVMSGAFPVFIVICMYLKLIFIVCLPPFGNIPEAAEWF